VKAQSIQLCLLFMRNTNSYISHVHYYAMLNYTANTVQQQDVFTPVAERGVAAVYKHATAFPVCTDARLLKYLSGYELVFTVMDDTGSTNDNDNNNEDSKQREHEVLLLLTLPLILLLTLLLLKSSQVIMLFLSLLSLLL
jgi:hypothetical protein